jgi:hypothetical protein
MKSEDVIRIHNESLYSTFKFIDDKAVTANRIERIDNDTVLVNDIVLINLAHVKAVTYVKEGTKI